MNRKIVGVLPNELKTSLRTFISSGLSHLEIIQKFIKYNDIYVSDYFNIYAMDTIAKLLTDEDFLVFSVDENENNKLMIVYVPEQVSSNQLNYFEKRREQLKQYPIEYLLKNSDNTFEIKEQSSTDMQIIDALIEDLKLREVKIEKPKSLVREKK